MKRDRNNLTILGGGRLVKEKKYANNCPQEEIIQAQHVFERYQQIANNLHASKNSRAG